MLPGFLIIAYLPAVLDTSGPLVVAAMLAFGCGQVFGTAVVARLIRWRGAALTLVLAACGVTLAAGLLFVTRRVESGEIAAMTALGFAVGIAMVPQQHRMFALVPAVAPIAMGLNGSAVYLSVALAAASGGGVLAVAGTAGLIPTAIIIGLLAVIVSLAVRPERRARREDQLAA
ncbi:hypothetical protein [Nocardia sp. NBC_00511]|uniref:hypothetical protein n=1 Tax=Nocardia sp. NBC_00511 TaxID=2903591 RepID=UPI0030E57964